ncbi:MAG: hypothetical protein EOP04_15100, partial [Proteobacteria bacterium]
MERSLQLIEKAFIPFRRYIDLKRLTLSDIEFFQRDRELSADSPRDKWGNWDLQFESKLEKCSEPWLDNKMRNARNIPWPDSHSFALILSHDIDSIRAFSVREYLTRLSRARLKDKFRIVLSYFKNSFLRTHPIKWNFMSWVALEEKHNAKSTWLVFPDSVKDWRREDCAYRWHESVKWTANETVTLKNALRMLIARGFEVGLHGSIGSRNDFLELRRQRMELEEVIATPVQALRMHYLSYDPKLSPAAIAGAGFKI